MRRGGKSYKPYEAGTFYIKASTIKVGNKCRKKRYCTKALYCSTSPPTPSPRPHPRPIDLLSQATRQPLLSSAPLPPPPPPPRPPRPRHYTTQHLENGKRSQKEGLKGKFCISPLSPLEKVKDTGALQPDVNKCWAEWWVVW